MKLQVRHAVNAHKALTAPLVLALMYAYDNWSVGPWVYLALHGSYGYLWLLKDQMFPDSKWNERKSVSGFLVVFVSLLVYWVAPLCVVQNTAPTPGWVVALSVCFTMLGSFLMFGSDAQKHFVHIERRGLVTHGFMARTRNPNYLGEMLIYAGFATITMHWLPWVINSMMAVGLFYPNMLRKDKSLSRYPEWKAYVERTGLLLPKF